MSARPSREDRARGWVALLTASLALASCTSGGGDEGDAGAGQGEARAAVSDEQVLQDVLTAWAQEHEEAAGSPVAVAVARPGSEPVVVSGGQDEGASVGPGDWFRFGSLTKTYVATAALRLAADGEIDLDDSVSSHVDGIPGGDDIAVRDLLDQTSGLPDYLADPAWVESVRSDPDRVWTARDALELVPSAAPSSNGFAYSNTNYVVAGLVLESVTGSPVGDVLSEVVLQPAGLEDTDYTGGGHPVVAGTADLGDGTLVSTTSGPYTAVETSAGAAGAMAGTVADLARFGTVLLDRSFVDDASWQQMTDFGPEGIYGLGLADLDALTSGQVTGLGNYGEIPGFSALLVVDPDTGTVLAAASGDDRAPAFDLGADLQQAVQAADEQAAGGAGIEEGEPDGGSSGTTAVDPATATAALFDGIDPVGPGCAVVVAQGDDVVHSDAWGLADLDTGTAMTAGTVVDIGSVSKQFTASAVLLLVQQGVVEADEPLATYLRDLPAWGGQVTVREAMHHTSGIPDYVELLLASGEDVEGATDTADALEVLRGTELSGAGSFTYSNSNYLLSVRW